MKFVLEIEMGDAVNTHLDVAGLLNFVHHQLREDGFTPGEHQITTRPGWRSSADGASSELVQHIVGKWEVVPTAGDPHAHIGVGHCPVCGHYGKDCTGTL